ALRSARDQQDRPRAARPRGPAGNGTRRVGGAGRAAVRLHELLHGGRARKGPSSHPTRCRREGRGGVTPPADYTSAGLPDEFAALDGPVDGGLQVGAPGKVGVLELSLARRGDTTRVVRQHQRAPMHFYRPIYLDPNLPEMAFVFVQQFGDGYVEGDRCHIELDCGPESAVHVTTQAATNLYRCRRNFATQVVNLRAARGAVLEYLPDAVVPFWGARFLQRTHLTADVDSTMIVGEVLLPGRVARGEI